MSVLAAPTKFTTSVVSPIGLTILVASNAYYQLGDNFEIVTQVFNASLHRILSGGPQQVNCTLDVYNASGNELIFMYNSELAIPSDPDYTFFITNRNITGVKGEYPYYIYCNNSFTAGFTGGSFVVSNPPDFYVGQDLMPLGIIILIPLVFSIVLLVGAVSLGKDHTALKIGMLLLSIPPFFISLNVSLLTLIRYYEFTALEELVATTGFIIGMSLAVFISYFLIYFIAYLFNIAAQQKKVKYEY